MREKTITFKHKPSVNVNRTTETDNLLKQRHANQLDTGHVKATTTEKLTSTSFFLRVRASEKVTIENCSEKYNGIE